MTLTEFREHSLGRTIIAKLGTVEAALVLWNLRRWPSP
jgi:hypothetical protein